MPLLPWRKLQAGMRGEGDSTDVSTAVRYIALSAVDIIVASYLTIPTQTLLGRTSGGVIGLTDVQVMSILAGSIVCNGNVVVCNNNEIVYN